MEVKASGEFTMLHANSVDKTTRYYLLQSSKIEPPSKPIDGAAIGSEWSKTEPDYPSDLDMSLYFVDQTIMSNGSIRYSEVSKSSSYEAANKAKEEAANAAKTATNYIGADANGLIVGDLTGDKIKRNVLISNDSVNIRNESMVVASFSEKLIELGKESKDATIDLLKGSATISTKQSEENDFLYYTTQIMGKQALELLTGGDENYAYIGISDRNTEYITAAIDMAAANKEDDGTISRGYATLESKLFDVELSYHKNKSQLTMKMDGIKLSSYNEGSGSAYIETVSDGSEVQINNTVSGGRGITLIEQYDDRLRLSKNGTLRASYAGSTPVLLSTCAYPDASFSGTLSMPVNEQPHGIVLEFAPYVNGAALNYGYATFFVPKARATGTSVCFVIGGSTFNKPCCKWIYIHNTKIVGNDVNHEKGTNNGITYDNALYVLTKVYGV